MRTKTEPSVAGAHDCQPRGWQHAAVEIVGTRHGLNVATSKLAVGKLLAALGVDEAVVGTYDGFVLLSFETSGQAQAVGRELSEFFASTPFLARPFEIRVGVGDTPALAAVALKALVGSGRTFCVAEAD
jgi:hypothetical protein